MCDCRKVYEEKLLLMFQKKHPDATDMKAEIGGYQFGYSNNELTMKPSMPVAVSMSIPKKSGGRTNKKHKTFIVASFCPFCGKPTNETEAQEGVA